MGLFGRILSDQHFASLGLKERSSAGSYQVIARFSLQGFNGSKAGLQGGKHHQKC
jgi:hypothetical protein